MTTDLDPIQAAEEALDEGAKPPEILRRFGMEAARQRKLKALLNVMHGFDPGSAAMSLGLWAAELVDEGHLVPRDRDGD